MSVKGFPSELETVVRDLWGLRVRILYGEKEDEGIYDSGTGTIGFDSTDGETDTDGGMSMASRRSRRSVNRRKGRLPRLIETLGLCYLGILLMRLPTSLGEIYAWASKEEIVFSRAVRKYVHTPRKWCADIQEDQRNTEGDENSTSGSISLCTRDSSSAEGVVDLWSSFGIGRILQFSDGNGISSFECSSTTF